MFGERTFYPEARAWALGQDRRKVVTLSPRCGNLRAFPQALSVTSGDLSISACTGVTHWNSGPGTGLKRRASGRRRECMIAWRSDEHTSELQSLMRTSYAVF